MLLELITFYKPQLVGPGKMIKNTILRFIAIACIPFLVWLGFIREETFVEMNELIMFKEHPEVGNHANETVEEYYNYSASELYKAKWYLTIQFTLEFFLFSGLILFLFFQNKKSIYYLAYFYLGLFILSGLSYISGSVTGNQQGAYLVARRLMGLLQSPYPFMLIFVLLFFKLDQKKNNSKY